MLVVLAVASVFVVGNMTVDINMCTYSVKLYARRKMITSSSTQQSKQRPLHHYHSTSANTHRLLAQLMDPAYQLMHHKTVRLHRKTGYGESKHMLTII